jgi:hypothetical protein
MRSPISPVSRKSTIVVRRVMVASLSSPRAARTAAAQLRMVPPTQNPRAWMRSTPAMSRLELPESEVVVPPEMLGLVDAWWP